MKERVPYQLQFDMIPALRQEINDLKKTVKTQQEGVNAATQIIDDLRKENTSLKEGIYLREVNNELAKYKNLYNKSVNDYIELLERYNNLMNKYIKL